MRRANYLRLTLGTAERVEDATLRFIVEQGLRVVLAVEIHKLPSDLGEDSSSDCRPVDPGAAATVGRDFTLQNESAVLDFDPTLVGEGCHILQLSDIEHSLDRGFIRAGANEIG